MNWLGKLFYKKKKGYNTDGQYKLLIIDEEADLLHENLGISEKRVEQLLGICIKAFEKSNAMHMALEKVIIECKHTNEVVMATLLLQKVVAKNESHERIHNILKSMFGRG